MSTPVFLEPQLGHFIEKFLYKAFFSGRIFLFRPCENSAYLGNFFRLPYKQVRLG